MRYRLRTLMIVAAIAPPLLALGVAAMAAIIIGGMPFSNREAVCWECGMQRETHEIWGRVTKDQIRQTQASEWAASLVPEGHIHSWSTTTLHQRTKWFGIAPIGCGFGAEGAFAAWQLARVGDQAAAEHAYLEYQDILNGKSPKSIGVHRKELEDAIVAADKVKKQQ